MGSKETTNWYALYTRARHEKRVHSRLRQKGIETYLPLIPRTSQWHDRKKVVEWPMFPGYVFARVSPERVTRTLDTPGVASVVRQAGEPAPIPEGEIENVRRFAAAVGETGEAPTPLPYVEEGQRVRIVSGPLSSVVGTVVERRGSGRVLIQIGVRAIGLGIKLEVEDRVLKAMER
jgi:transcriptional antiterminator NusG